MNLALFDLDGTLIPKDSDHAFGEFVISLGWADAQDFRRRNDAFYQDYAAGRLDISAYIDFATAPWRNRAPADLARATARFVELVVRPMLPAAAIELVQRHQRAGDLVAVVTATNDFVTRPIAQALGVDQLIATELARDEAGRVTGAIRGVPAFREGKVTRVQHWLAARGQVLEGFSRSVFYSDSTNDLPLLERVSEPVATNPGPALERIALERGWPVLKFFT
jgi:HAD superfamily hydrolase (TIGR01490 family)